jgi:hypothetical protein
MTAPLYRWRQRILFDELLDSIEKHARTTLPEAAAQLRAVDEYGEEIGCPITAGRLVRLRADLLRLRPVLEELGINLRD